MDTDETVSAFDVCTSEFILSRISLTIYVSVSIARLIARKRKIIISPVIDLILIRQYLHLTLIFSLKYLLKCNDVKCIVGQYYD